MKYLLVICLFISSCGSEPVQPPPSGPVIIKDSNIIKREAANPYVQTDISPMDMVYYPTDYPVKKMNGQASEMPLVRVIYSRPHRGGRKLFGSLVKWGQPWRLGANEATEIQFFQPVTILNKKLDKGQYVMYAIPYEDKWIIAFNRNLYSWGLKFDPSNDVLRVEVSAITKAQTVEDFTMTFEKTSEATDLIMAWESMEVRLPIQF
jgi:hypothetical protein